MQRRCKPSVATRFLKGAGDLQTKLVDDIVVHLHLNALLMCPWLLDASYLGISLLSPRAPLSSALVKLLSTDPSGKIERGLIQTMRDGSGGSKLGGAS